MKFKIGILPGDLSLECSALWTSEDRYRGPPGMMGEPHNVRQYVVNAVDVGKLGGEVVRSPVKMYKSVKKMILFQILCNKNLLV